MFSGADQTLDLIDTDPASADDEEDPTVIDVGEGENTTAVSGTKSGGGSSGSLESDVSFDVWCTALLVVCTSATSSTAVPAPSHRPIFHSEDRL